ncbi:MAG: hypothetical protein ACXAC8_18000 [Candidatus Hodarchaeales archaeon]
MSSSLTIEMILIFSVVVAITIISFLGLIVLQRKNKKKIQSSVETNIAATSNMPKYAFIVSVIFSIFFIVLIWVLGPLLRKFELGPDLGPTWYYWQLPVPDITTQIIVWTFYLAHQVSLWILIYWAQKNVSKLREQSKYGLTNYNWFALITNGFFIFLHLFQTHIWYDGLAQDVPIWTSQGSVIVMLVFLLIMQNRQRGIILGKKAGKPITREVARFFMKTHMYVFSWALVYTFWFHPMDSDPQLLTGFLYMFLLFAQVSLSYTRFHLNRKWIIFLEGFVGVHAVVVAVNNTLMLGSSDMWPMFLSGFVFMVVFTYLYSLKMRSAVRWAIFLAFAGFLMWIYLPFGYGRDFSYLIRLEVLWIPIVLYGLAYLFAGIVFMLQKLRKSQVEDIKVVPSSI